MSIDPTTIGIGGLALTALGLHLQAQRENRKAIDEQIHEYNQLANRVTALETWRDITREGSGHEPTRPR